MDTDYLTERAYEVLIGEAGEVSEFLRADIGASSRFWGIRVKAQTGFGVRNRPEYAAFAESLPTAAILYSGWTSLVSRCLDDVHD